MNRQKKRVRNRLRKKENVSTSKLGLRSERIRVGFDLVVTRRDSQSERKRGNKTGIFCFFRSSVTKK